ncbi:MAG: hypothetical protein EZS28_038908, partial [Streblomastix strix]
MYCLYSSISSSDYVTFGVIYEEYKSDQNDQVYVNYGYILPRDTRIQEHAPKVTQSEDDIE